jgi:hypothetical protein
VSSGLSGLYSETLPQNLPPNPKQIKDFFSIRVPGAEPDNLMHSVLEFSYVNGK